MKRLVAIAIMAALASTPALAQSYQPDPHTGLYLGAGLGQSKLDNDSQDFLSSMGASTDDTDTAYKLFVGYDFNPNFSVEASYVDFGKFTADLGPESLRASADGFGVAMLGRLPIQNGFGIYGKVGLIAWDGDARYRDSSTGTVIRDGVDSTDPFYGIGGEYVVDQFMVRAEYEYFDLRDSGEDFTIELISVGIGYLF